jgi:hypothetical protein
MAFWSDKAASASNLRLFEPTNGWRAHDDSVNEQRQITAQGSRIPVELALHTALNANNLVMLTGAGSSFCAKNAAGKKTPPTMTDLWDAVKAGVGTAEFEATIKKIPNAADLDKNIEKLLTLCKLYSALFIDDNAKKVAQFVESAEKAIVERVDFVADATDLAPHRNLIRKFARRSVRKPRAKIFTTNYDLCFEYAARQLQFVVVDGFSHTSPQSYDSSHFFYDIVRRGSDDEPPDYIENVFHLYKLHGSIDWRRKDAVLVRSKSETDGSPVLIYPRDSKFQEAFASPYLDMMAALQASLRGPDTLLIISGFGFNDDHITKPIFAAIEANISLRVVLCDVAFLADAPLENGPFSQVLPLTSEIRTKNNVYLDQLKKLVALGDQRITILNGRFEDLAFALPDLVAQTDRERHLDRMQQFRRQASEGGGN